MPTTDAAHNVDHWWKTAATDLGLRRVVVLRGRHRHTHIRVRKTATVVHVARTDRSTLTAQPGGRWTIAHAADMATTRHRHSRTLRALIWCSVIATVGGIVAAVDADTATRMIGVVVAVLGCGAAAWLWWAQHTSRVDRILAADRAATTTAGIDAARQALAGDNLYRSAAHEWVAEHNVLSARRRLALIESRST